MRKIAASTLVAGAFSLAALAQSLDVPLRNWTVPSYKLASAGGGVTTMTDVTFPGVLVGIDPCRVADTRGINGFSGQAGAPALTLATRNFQIADIVPGAPIQCGIPFGAHAVSLQFTIVTPSAPGNLIAWPAGGTQPNASVLNWDAGTSALGNGTIVPLSGNGAISVRLNAGVGGATAHLVIDVNGYFGHQAQNPAFPVGWVNDNPGGSTGHFENNANSGSSRGLVGIMHSAANDAAGVIGSAGGVIGYGVVTYQNSGVRGVGGLSESIGVLGISPFLGVAGSLVGDAGEVAWGGLGHLSYGVYASGDYAGTGAKYFVEPHPTDASKVIRYIALEGPEAGTYFRGRGRFQRGVARIAVPDDFRMVTDEEGLTVQITPIGPMATFSVVKAGLSEIVVQASRNVEFYYLVQGVRRTHKHITSPIGDGAEYMPRSAEAKMPLWLTERQRQLLIQNGTYREDGTVNMDTARQLGWDRIWEQRTLPRPQPAEP